MNTRYLFMLASGGIIAGLFSVFFYNENIKAKDPIAVSFNPYDSGVYASGIVESFQKNGSNINLYPFVSGEVTESYVQDGSLVKKDDPLLLIDNSIQLAVVEKDNATVRYEKANLETLTEQYNKLKRSYEINEKSVSKNALDTARIAVISAQESLNIAKAQTDADVALLDRYTIRAPVDGIIMRVVSSIGDYVSPVIGAYDPTTEANLPVIQMGESTSYYQVRVYVDEILTPQLPPPDAFEATLFVRGMNNKSIALEYVNMQPYTIPNIELSNQRNERVDVRVLPIIFKFKKPKDINLYPGQLVDVYIKGKS